MDWATIGIDAAKYFSGIGTAAVTYFTVQGLRPKKPPNGHSGNTELLNLIHDSMKSGFEENAKAHTEVFGQLREVRKDVTNVREKVSYLEGKTEDKPKKPQAKPLKHIQCLVLDDSADTAESTSRIIESYLNGTISCTPVSTISDVEEKLRQQEYNLTIIDYYLNTSENGYDVYKYFQQAYPKMKCLIYSGQNPDTIPSAIKDIYIEKPFRREIVIDKIQKLLN